MKKKNRNKNPAPKEEIIPHEEPTDPDIQKNLELLKLIENFDVKALEEMMSQKYETLENLGDDIKKSIDITIKIDKKNKKVNKIISEIDQNCDFCLNRNFEEFFPTNLKNPYNVKSESTEKKEVNLRLEKNRDKMIEIFKSAGPSSNLLKQIDSIRELFDDEINWNNRV